MYGERYSCFIIASADSCASARLAEIGDKGRDLFREYDIGLVVVEKVRSSTGHVLLTNSVGVAYDIADADNIIEIPSGMWKKVVDKHYFKDDVQDALYMWKLVKTLCEEDK